jgi:hypothetical protein
MTLGELKQIIDETLESMPSKKDCKVTVPVSGEHGIGATPSAKIRSAGAGIDFDNWQFMLYTETPVYKKPPTIK